MNPLPPITKALLWAIAGVFVLQMLAEELLFIHFALWPVGNFVLGPGPDGLPVSVGFQPWQLVSYSFLHGGFAHLFLNGLALYQFGGRIEQVLGERRYLTYYFTCVVGAGLIQLLVTGIMLESGVGPFPTVGASGGIFGLLLAYALMFPKDRVMLLLPPIPMSARTLVIVFGVISLVMGVTGTAAGVAHFAHLGGMIFGWLLLRYWRKQPPFRPRRPSGPRSIN